MFADWWNSQGTEARNIWLRSMGIRLTFENTHGAVAWHVQYGYMELFEENLKLGRSAAEAVRQLTADK
ncbi:hypothetical protein [Mycobacterium sp.]|uniref:hypothetical protein n=1 Tax=Mycobacterium sp. TaxID=1785 RepID=UPI003BAC5E28